MKDELREELDGIASSLTDAAGESYPPTPFRAAAVPAAETVAPPDVVRQQVGVDRVVKLLSESQSRLQQFQSDFAAQVEKLARIELGESHAKQNFPARQAFLRLKPVVVRLVAYSSGLIESARIPELDKIEIGLLLAGVEHELARASASIA